MTKLRKSARGKPCTLRFPGICNHDWSTVVLAHVTEKGNHGMGLKPPDTSAVYACSSCHDVLDGRVQVKGERFVQEEEIRRVCVAMALKRTHELMREDGLL